MKKAFVVRSVIGWFAFGKERELLYYTLFENSPEKVFQLLKEHEPDVFKKGLKDYDVEYGKYEFQDLMRERLREYAVSLGFAETRQLNEFLSRLGLIMAKAAMKGVIGRDRLIIQAANALFDLEKTVNGLEERIYEWYSLHYPEMRREKIVEHIAQYGKRENMPGFVGSTGVELTSDDEETIGEFARSIIDLNHKKDKIESYIRKAVKEIMPNFSALIDPILAARLLTLAGSLERLAKMPASTIQLLGAEKALFRHMKKHGKSPKHGIIVTASFVQNAENRGRASRILSSKLAMAARIDFYSQRDESERFKKELDMEKV